MHPWHCLRLHETRLSVDSGTNIDSSQEHPQLPRGDKHEKEHKKKKKHKKKKHKLRALSPRLEQSLDTETPAAAGDDMELLASPRQLSVPLSVSRTNLCQCSCAVSNSLDTCVHFPTQNRHQTPRAWFVRCRTCWRSHDFMLTCVYTQTTPLSYQNEFCRRYSPSCALIGW